MEVVDDFLRGTVEPTEDDLKQFVDQNLVLWAVGLGIREIPFEQFLQDGAPALLEQVEAVVGGDAVDPGEERTLLPETGKSAKDLDQNILRCIPRLFLVAEDSSRLPENNEAVAFVNPGHFQRRVVRHAVLVG